MKRLAALLVCVAVLVSGCGQATTDDSPANGNSGYSDSAPAKMLEAPEKAREAAGKASENAQETMDAIEEID